MSSQFYWRYKRCEAAPRQPSCSVAGRQRLAWRCEAGEEKEAETLEAEEGTIWNTFIKRYFESKHQLPSSELESQVWITHRVLGAPVKDRKLIYRIDNVWRPCYNWPYFPQIPTFSELFKTISRKSWNRWSIQHKCTGHWYFTQKENEWNSATGEAC